MNSHSTNMFIFKLLMFGIKNKDDMNLFFHFSSWSFYFIKKKNRNIELNYRFYHCKLSIEKKYIKGSNFFLFFSFSFSFPFTTFIFYSFNVKTI
jgi:hypothetical protein